jgi:hypothetical protein
MKFIIYESTSQLNYSILIQDKDGSYRLFGTCNTRAAADQLCKALNFADQNMPKQKGKK